MNDDLQDRLDDLERDVYGEGEVTLADLVVEFEDDAEDVDADPGDDGLVIDFENTDT